MTLRSRPRPHGQRPDDRATNCWITTREGRAQARAELSKWVGVGFPPTACERGPGTEISDELVGAKLVAKLEIRVGKLAGGRTKGGGDVAVAGLDQTPLGLPEAAKALLVELRHHGIDRSIDGRETITDQRDDATGAQHPRRFGEKTLGHEPMKRLRGKHEIRSPVVDGKRFGGRLPVCNTGVRFGVLQLTRARLDANDVIEMLGERQRGLAAASADVDRQLARGADRSQPFEKRGRIVRAKTRVRGGLPGEKILEGQDGPAS
jgi:hypothetical protein